MLLVFQLLLFPHGMFRVNPENISVSIKPYFCHINQHRLGHYDAVKPINLPTSTTTPQCCHRGSNKKKFNWCWLYQHNWPVFNTSYKSRQPCTVRGCKNCSNPHGSRPATIKPEKQSLPQGRTKTSKASVSVYGNQRRGPAHW